MKNKFKIIPLDAEAVDDKRRSDLQREVPPRALQEPQAPLLYITRSPDVCRHEVESYNNGRRTLLPKKRQSLLD